MTIVRGKIIGGGRVALPADMRRALNLTEGDTVYFSLDEDGLCIRSAKAALKRVQDRLRHYGTRQPPASEELIAVRGEDAAGE